MIQRRLASGRLHRLDRGVYALGHLRLSVRSRWMAAVLACGDGAVLSHGSAASLWGLSRPRPGPIHVTGRRRRSRTAGEIGPIRVHEGRLAPEDRASVAGIPVTSVARTLLDLAETVEERRLEKAFEEADRLGLLEMTLVEAECDRGRGRRGVGTLRRLIEEARAPDPGRTPLENRLAALCREHELPPPRTNVEVLGREVDAFWPERKLVVEADGWAFHRHRAAFERDRERDAKMQVAGYRVIRLTHRRLEREPGTVAAEIQRLLAMTAPPSAKVGRGRDAERGQGTVEWIGLIAVVALLVVATTAAADRLPGAGLARAVASTLLCAAALADRCGDEPVLIAAYGSEVGRLVREQVPVILFERGSRALPVDFRRCRDPSCGDGSARGLVTHTDAGLPVTAFVHVIDCRTFAGPRPDCSGERAGNLYIQYWLYYADSATMRGVPLAGEAGYHRDDWESVQVRIGPDGQIDERASSHRGFNHDRGAANAASDAGVGSLRELAEAVGARPRNGWGPQRGLLQVSGGSHAGNTGGRFEFDRIVAAGRVHLVPLESLAAGYRFAVSPPWRKDVWRDPEAATTG